MKCSRCECEINLPGVTYWQLPKTSGDARVRGWTDLCGTCHKVWIHYSNPGTPVTPPTETVEHRADDRRQSPHLEAVNHPAHYNAGQFEVIAVIEDWKLGFNDGNAVKYLGRARHKGKMLEDSEKARWYVNRFVQEQGGTSWNPEDYDDSANTNIMQRQVREFMDVMIGHPIADMPATWPDAQSKMRCLVLVEGEYKELKDGILADDWVEIIDGACDLLYVVFYLCNTIGVDITPFFNEVQRTNLAKQGGPIDPETGKQLKPPGWKPPDIGVMLQKLRDKALRENGLKR